MEIEEAKMAGDCNVIKRHRKKINTTSNGFSNRVRGTRCRFVLFHLFQQTLRRDE